MKTLLFSLFLMFSISLSAQYFRRNKVPKHKISFEVNYFVDNDSYFSKAYSPYIDAGFRFRLINLEGIRFGLSINTAMSTFDLADKVFLYYIQPRAFAEINVAKAKWLHPSIGIGPFTRLVQYQNENDKLIVSLKELGGTDLSMNAGISAEIYKRIFAQIQYDIVFSRSFLYRQYEHYYKVGIGYIF